MKTLSNEHVIADTMALSEYANERQIVLIVWYSIFGFSILWLSFLWFLILGFSMLGFSTLGFFILEFFILGFFHLPICDPYIFNHKWISCVLTIRYFQFEKGFQFVWFQSFPSGLHFIIRFNCHAQNKISSMMPNNSFFALDNFENNWNFA